MIEPSPMKLVPDAIPVDAVPEALAAPAESSKWALWTLSAFILAVGLVLRIWPSAGYTSTGFDEVLYQINVAKLEKTGFLGYDQICRIHIEDQRKPETTAKLPPTRFVYIAAAYLWKKVEFGDAPPLSPKSPNFVQADPGLVSLHRVAVLFSCLGLIVSGLAAWRLLGVKYLPAVLALLACSPLAIQLSQHAMIDGVFTFWAMLCLWLLWENLQHPHDRRRLVAYGLSLAFMVMTKENSFFVYLALCGLILANRWTHLGTVTRGLLWASFLGPVAGVGALMMLAGGVSPFIEIYRLLVIKAQTLTYAIKTGDGPWYRYLVDLLLLSPLVLLLAIGGTFTQLRQHRALIFLVAFVGFSYVIMCNVRYGMNLRYASIWDLPLRALAATQVVALTAWASTAVAAFNARHQKDRRSLPIWNLPGRAIALLGTREETIQVWLTSIAIVLLCLHDLNQYKIYFINGQLYELVTGGLLWSVKILK